MLNILNHSTIDRYRWLLVSCCAIVIALVVAGALIALLGYDPLDAYVAMARGSFGSTYALSVTAVRAAPLLIIGLGFLIGYRAGLFNVGGEGQLYAGAVGATLVGLVPVHIPAIIHLPLALLASFVFGALWAAIPAYLRAYYKVNEIVTTLMFNYLGYHLVSYLINANNGPLFQEGAAFAQSSPVAKTAELPILLGGTSLHLGALLAVVLAVATYFAIGYTAWGFKLRMIGLSLKTARYAGVNYQRQIFWAILIGGGMGGLAGGCEILGLRHHLYQGLSPGYGYDAVAVVLLANGNALGTIVASIFFGALRSGGNLMQQTIGLDVSVVFIIQALIIFFLLTGIALKFKPRHRVRVPRIVKSHA